MDKKHKAAVVFLSNTCSRLQRLPYLGYKVQDKKKVTRSVKNARTMSEKICSHALTTAVSANSFLCGSFNKFERKRTFYEFWTLSSWEKKKAYMCGLVTTRTIRKRRVKEEPLIRIKECKSVGHNVFLKDKHGLKKRVCCAFFIQTLRIDRDSFKRWVEDKKI